MFDIGGSELLLIGVVALLVVGPKDLPGMFHALGRFTAKARSMAREFSRAMEDAAKDSGVQDVANDLKGITSPKSLGLEKVQEAVGKFEAWDPMKKAAPTVKEPAPGKAGTTKTESSAKGPETQALADKLASEKAKRAEAAAERRAAKGEIDGDTAAKPAKSVPKPKTKPKAAPKPRKAAAPKKPVKAAASKPAKPRAKKSAP